MLAVLSTHPIQYHSPIWQRLADSGRVPFEVWYLTAHGVQPTMDLEFGASFKWEIDLLGGYPYRFPAGRVPPTLGKFRDARLPRDFRRRLVRGDVHAVLVPGWQVLACWQTIAAAHRAGVSTWIRGDSNDLKHEPAPKRLAKRVLLGALFNRVDRFLCVGSANTRLYRSYGIPEDRLISAPHAVDNERFATQAKVLSGSRREIRRAWGIPDQAFCVLFAGKLISKKRPGDVMSALRSLHTLDPRRHYHGLFVGSGKLGSMLREQCRVVFDGEASAVACSSDPGAPPATFAGFLNQRDISRAYVAADALVLPSDAGETWGLVVNEALASGLPCIASDQCGSAEDLVVQLDAALRFRMGDVEALARAIIHLAEHPITKDSMAALVARHSVTATVEAIERLWSELPTH